MRSSTCWSQSKLFRFGSTIDGGVGAPVMDCAGGERLSMKGNAVGDIVAVAVFVAAGCCWGWACSGACACANGTVEVIGGSASDEANVDLANVGSRGRVSGPHGG